MGKNIVIDDAVNHPSHYSKVPDIEAIDVAAHFSFCLGSALKYIWRCDHKGDPVTDIRKAIWMLNREIETRIKQENYRKDHD